MPVFINVNSPFNKNLSTLQLFTSTYNIKKSQELYFTVNFFGFLIGKYWIKYQWMLSEGQNNSFVECVCICFSEFISQNTKNMSVYILRDGFNQPY